MDISLPDINTNYAGFASLIELNEEINNCVRGEDIIINMPNWFSANMCSPFGAILKLASRKVGSFRFNPGNKKVLDILNKNYFLQYIGCRVIPLRDAYDTTIKYRQFFPREGYFFNNYIKNDFMRRLPSMSNSLSKAFENSIFEIFTNAVIHSETETIFVCGQDYFNKKIVDFSITDIGMGFHNNVTSITGQYLTPVEAIEWAMYGNNTTKKGQIPGGLGLKSIKEFIMQNKGKMQIASDSGYWELSNGTVKTEMFLGKFPGSVVNIEINTADPCLYRLQEEIESEDIF